MAHAVLAENGVTTRFHGLRPTNIRDHSAGAEGEGAWKHGSRALAWPRITPDLRDGRLRLKRSSLEPRVEMARREPRSPGMQAGWREDWRTWSISSILMSWCSAEVCQNCPISTSSYRS